MSQLREQLLSELSVGDPYYSWGSTFDPSCLNFNFEQITPLTQPPEIQLLSPKTLNQGGDSTIKLSQNFNVYSLQQKDKYDDNDDDDTEDEEQIEDSYFFESSEEYKVNINEDKIKDITEDYESSSSSSEIIENSPQFSSGVQPHYQTSLNEIPPVLEIVNLSSEDDSATIKLNYNYHPKTNTKPQVIEMNQPNIMSFSTGDDDATIKLGSNFNINQMYDNEESEEESTDSSESTTESEEEEEDYDSTASASFDDYEPSVIIDSESSEESYSETSIDMEENEELIALPPCNPTLVEIDPFQPSENMKNISSVSITEDELFTDSTMRLCNNKKKSYELSSLDTHQYSPVISTDIINNDDNDEEEDDDEDRTISNNSIKNEEYKSKSFSNEEDEEDDCYDEEFDSEDNEECIEDINMKFTENNSFSSEFINSGENTTSESSFPSRSPINLRKNIDFHKENNQYRYSIPMMPMITPDGQTVMVPVMLPDGTPLSLAPDSKPVFIPTIPNDCNISQQHYIQLEKNINDECTAFDPNTKIPYFPDLSSYGYPQNFNELPEGLDPIGEDGLLMIKSSSSSRSKNIIIDDNNDKKESLSTFEENESSNSYSSFSSIEERLNEFKPVKNIDIQKAQSENIAIVKNRSSRRGTEILPTTWASAIHARESDIITRPRVRSVITPIVDVDKALEELSSREELSKTVSSVSKREASKVEKKKRQLKRLHIKQKSEIENLIQKLDSKEQIAHSKMMIDIERAHQLMEKEVRLFERQQSKTTVKEKETEFDEITKLSNQKQDKLIASTEQEWIKYRKELKKKFTKRKQDIINEQKNDLSTKKRSKATYDKKYIKKLKSTHKIGILVAEKLYITELSHMKKVSDAKLRLQQQSISCELVEGTNKEIFNLQLALLQERNSNEMEAFNRFSDKKIDLLKMYQIEKLCIMQQRQEFELKQLDKRFKEEVNSQNLLIETTKNRKGRSKGTRNRLAQIQNEAQQIATVAQAELDNIHLSQKNLLQLKFNGEKEKLKYDNEEELFELKKEIAKTRIEMVKKFHKYEFELLEERKERDMKSLKDGLLNISRNNRSSQQEIFNHLGQQKKELEMIVSKETNVIPEYISEYQKQIEEFLGELNNTLSEEFKIHNNLLDKRQKNAEIALEELYEIRLTNLSTKCEIELEDFENVADVKEG